MTEGLIDMAHAELRSLVTKAARGAGLDWGLAEEAGWAAEWLARRSMPAAEWAVTWLDCAASGGPNPIDIGAAFADRMAFGDAPLLPEILPDDLLAPGYLLPFLHLVSMRHGAVEIMACDERAALIEPNGTFHFGHAWGARTSGWSICRAVTKVQASRNPVEQSDIARLEAMALRTTVPPSVKSRQGAGSSMSDND